jgi:hypothetical protein
MSPAVLEKVVRASVRNTSYAEAEKELAESAELNLAEGRLQRATRRIAEERMAERQAETQAWEALPLPERQKGPQTEVEVAVVEVDGGRIQIRDRGEQEPVVLEELDQDSLEQALEEESLFQAESSGKSPRKGRFWRESKGGSLISYTSARQDHDPCPEVPEAFLHPAWVHKLVSEVHGGVGPSKEDAPSAAEEAQAQGEPREGLPKPLVRTVLASRRPWKEFGAMLAAAAWRRGFAGAARKVFLADGSRTLWVLWALFFSHFTPIVDFIHALGYVYAAALAGRSAEEGWSVYTRWLRWLWGGEISRILDELETRQREIGLPAKNAPANSPQNQVAAAIRYLTANQGRMKYAQYRCEGLPLTTSFMESTIKQIGRRVKGTEKFWSEQGGDGMLHLRADYLSDTDPLHAFFQRRQKRATGQRHYRTNTPKTAA